MKQLPPLRATDDPQFLEGYVAWARGKREAHIRWLSPDRAELQADTGPNEGGSRKGKPRHRMDPVPGRHRKKTPLAFS
jgi:hypothetical protein